MSDVLTNVSIASQVLPTLKLVEGGKREHSLCGNIILAASAVSCCSLTLCVDQMLHGNV